MRAFNGHEMTDGNEAATDFGRLSAVADGIIEQVFTRQGTSEMSAEFGNCVLVREDGEVYRLYHHLNERPGRAVGDPIGAGQYIGDVDVMPDPPPAPRRKSK